MPKITSVQKTFIAILIRLMKIGDLKAASHLVEAIHDPEFNLDIFKRIIMYVKEGEEGFLVGKKMKKS